MLFNVFVVQLVAAYRQGDCSYDQKGGPESLQIFGGVGKFGAYEKAEQKEKCITDYQYEQPELGYSHFAILMRQVSADSQLGKYYMPRNMTATPVMAITPPAMTCDHCSICLPGSSPRPRNASML